MAEIFNPGDRVRVLGVIRGTVVIRQLDGGSYSYLIDVENGSREVYPASVVERIGMAAPERCEAEREVDRAWADHDEAERIARERALHLTLGDDDDPDEIDWLP